MTTFAAISYNKKLSGEGKWEQTDEQQQQQPQRAFVATTQVIISSEGALIAITPYDYPQQQQHPLFEHTPVLDNNLNINAMMTLVTMITIKTEITKTKSAASVA